MARTHKSTAIKMLKEMNTQRMRHLRTEHLIPHNDGCVDVEFVNELLNHLLMACCKKNCSKHIALAKAKFIAHIKS